MDALEALTIVEDQCERQIEQAILDRARAEDALQATQHARAQLNGSVSSPGVEAQDPPASPPPSEPADPNSAEAKEPSAPDDSPPVPLSPSRSLGSKQEQARRKAAAVDDVVRVVSGAKDGPLSRGQIGLPLDLRPHQLIEAVREAVHLGRIESIGRGPATRYRAVETKTPVTPPAARREPPVLEPETPKRGGPPVERQQPTLEGRIFSACQTPRTASQLSVALGITLSDLAPKLSAMMREGDLRTRRVEGQMAYASVLA